MRVRAKSVEEYWRAHVQMRGDDECWPWLGEVCDSGYGRIRNRKFTQGKTYKAHRVALALAGRPVPDGVMALHSCDNRRCCNPAHLRPGTVQENSRDMVARGRSLYGRRNPAAKLSEVEVRAIRDMWGRGATSRVIADAIGVSFSAAWRIATRKTWKHVP